MTPLGHSHSHPHISAQGAHIENRPGEFETMPMVTPHAKFEVSMMIRLGCRGGGLKTIYNILYSVQPCTRGAEIQNEEGPKTLAPPQTAQTTRTNGMFRVAFCSLGLYN